MTRSIHRRSMTMRMLCAYVVLVVIVSFAGVGYAVPGSRGSANLASNESTASAPPATEEPPVAEDPAVVPPEEEAAPPEEEAPAPEEEAVAPEDEVVVPEEDAAAEEPPAEEPSGNETVTPAKVSPLDPAPLDAGTLGDGDTGLYATANGIYPTYIADWTDHTCSYSEFKIEAADLQAKTYNVPGGGSIEIKNLRDFFFDFQATGLLIHHVQVKAGTGELVYDYDPSGTTADQNLYSVYKEIETACDFREISHITFCYTRPTPSQGHIIITKYWDEDRDGWRDGGEDWLGGFQFVLEKYDPITGAVTPLVDPLTGTAPMIRWSNKANNGQADFGMWPFGWYQVSEVLTSGQIAAGWFCTDAEGYVRQFNHVREANGQEEDQTKWFGNSQLEEYTKKFKLTYEGTVPPNTTFHVTYKVDGVDHQLALTGSSSPFQGQEDLLEGVEITDVYWHAVWTPEGGSPVDIVLGHTADDPCLEGDLTNRFTYGGQLSGHKYEDMNANGTKNAGDHALSGWRIYMMRKVDGQWMPYASDVTDSNGYYDFTGVLPGTYRVYEDIAAQTPPDWVCSKPALGYYELTFNALGMPTTVSPACVGTQYSNKDFLNWAPASIHGTKFEDLNKDGERDPLEPGLANWTIFVDYNGDGVLNSHPVLGAEPFAITGVDGSYEITGVHPGTFMVREQMVPGWFQSYPSFGSYEVKFESRGDYGLEFGYDFGNWTTALKAGMKFEDLNANGVKDSLEPGLPGWTIFVDYNDNGILDSDAELGQEPSAVTGADGSYQIIGIVPGTWNVREVLTGDWVQSYPADGYYSVDFVSSLEDTGNDFGNWEPASIEGYKFNDLAIDGEFNDEDYGLEGWTIFVDYNGNGILDSDAELGPEPYDETDSDGYYKIDGVHPGTFMVREVDQTDWTQSRGDFQVEFLSQGHYGSEGEYDFGNWTTTRLSGYKFEDKNANGAWDSGEEAPNAAFTIMLSGEDFLGNSVTTTTTTDADGYYEFTDVVPGEYQVSEIAADGWHQSYPADGHYDVTLYSDIVVEMSFDFGNWTPADPHGHKIHDLNANGQNDEEPTLEGWQIHISGTTGWGESYDATTTTDANGYWEFDEVPPGTYTITEVQQPGWSQSWPENDGGYGMTLESGEIPEEDFDFLNWTTATKFGMKFYDADGDGLPREEGEIGLPGWKIFVDYNLNGTWDEGEPFGITDASGAYMITDIIPGFYPVMEVNTDPDWMVTYPRGGYYYEEFVSQGVYEGNDFGNTSKVDKTFELTFEADAPEDTTFTVTFSTEYTPLRDNDIPVVNSTSGLGIPMAPEDHELELVETEPGSGVYTAKLAMWPQTMVTGVEWWAGYKGERIKLGDGAAEELIDAPVTNEFEYGARAFGSKWNDTDYEGGQKGDGVWDKTSEPGIEGWTIRLYRKNASGDWALYDVAATDADGAYAFADLLPGEYYAAEVIPLDPDTGEPLWTQSAGPAGEGDQAFEVADGSAIGPVDFGNYEPFLPFTPPTEEPDKVTPTKTETESEPYLPFTGGEVMLLVSIMLMAAAAGTALRQHGKRAA